MTSAGEGEQEGKGQIPEGVQPGGGVYSSQGRDDVGQGQGLLGTWILLPFSSSLQPLLLFLGTQWDSGLEQGGLQRVVRD